MVIQWKELEVLLFSRATDLPYRQEKNIQRYLYLQSFIVNRIQIILTHIFTELFLRARWASLRIYVKRDV